MKLKSFSFFCIAVALTTSAFAADRITLKEIIVTAPKIGDTNTYMPLSSSVLEDSEFKHLLPATSDTANLLSDILGVSLFSAGGISSLPSIHGMADDRLRIKVNGMDLIAACPNHMNSVLSYIDPTAVGNITVFAGITPVSMGGDSIGGTISVNSAEPLFAKPGEGILLKGSSGVYYRSNGNANGGNVSTTVATENLSVSYIGNASEAVNYNAARDFKPASAASTDKPNQWISGKEVGSSAYKAENHAVGLALRHENHLLDLKVGFQNVPYELFPNQRMDMTANQSFHGNLRYRGEFNWGDLEARFYKEKTLHTMDFGRDKQYMYTGAPGMPMDTEGRNSGAITKADIKFSEQDVLRIGVEYQGYRLNDWWSPSSPTPGLVGGMSPYTFLNINNGKRDRYAVFSEWESKLNSEWLTLLGARFERVEMNAEAVHGYNYETTGMYAQGYFIAASEFNTADRTRVDNNLDFTALARYTPNEITNLEFGYAHKTRSPNLYERYTWSRNAMAMIMNNFVGDGNGYLGDPYLKPEKANTVSATLDLHSEDRSIEFKGTPYYTVVSDYIDAIQWNRTTNTEVTALTTNNFVTLKYVNQYARIYGMDFSGRIPLTKNSSFGEFSLAGLVNYTNGRNGNTHDALYNIMPLNGKFSVSQKLEQLSNIIEMQWVGSKKNISDMRQEIQTTTYTLFNLRSSYEMKYARVDLGVENLFNKFYSLPLGGAYAGHGATMNITGIPWGTQVPGMGRSLYAGLSFKF